MAERSGSGIVPKNLPDFQKHFPNDEACIAHLYAKRFPAGFVCRYLNNTKAMLVRPTPLPVAPQSTVAATASAAAATYSELYEGAWEHPGVWQE